MGIDWKHKPTIQSNNYKCAHCENNVATTIGTYGRIISTDIHAYLYICHLCDKPTYLEIVKNKIITQIPAIAYGNPVGSIEDKSVNLLYCYY